MKRRTQESKTQHRRFKFERFEDERFKDEKGEAMAETRLHTFPTAFSPSPPSLFLFFFLFSFFFHSMDPSNGEEPDPAPLSVKNLKTRFENGEAEGAQFRPRLTFINDKAMLAEKVKVRPSHLSHINDLLFLFLFVY